MESESNDDIIKLSETTQEEYTPILKETGQKIKEIMEGRTPLQIDTVYIDAPYNEIQVRGGTFSFTADIKNTGIPNYNETRNRLCGNIKKIFIPERYFQAELRKKCLGTEIVKAWEQSLRDTGIGLSIATNVNLDALEFWEKMGYQIAEGSRTPEKIHCMYKELEGN